LNIPTLILKITPCSRGY